MMITKSARTTAGALLLGIGAVGCSPSGTPAMPAAHVPAQQAGVVRHAMFAYDFTSMEQMLATSDLVVLGTVTDVAKGEVTGGSVPDEVEAAGGGEGDGAVQAYIVSLRADQILGGTGATAVAKGAVLPIRMSSSVELPLPVSGARGVFFLKRQITSTAYGFINDEGVFLLDGPKVDSVTDAQDAWIGAVQGHDLGTLLKAVAVAKVKVQKGQVQPAQPVV